MGFRQLSNIDGSLTSKAAIKSKINSGDWSSQPTKEIIDMCCEIGQYDSQSRNIDDMIEQKKLWLMMFMATKGYDPLSFYSEGLVHGSVLHHGKLPLCLQHLRTGSKPIHPDVGEWRLWENPEFVPPAKEVAAKKAEAAKYLSKMTERIDSALPSQYAPVSSPTAERLEDRIDRELTPKRATSTRRRSRSTSRPGKGKGHPKGFDERIVSKGYPERGEPATPQWGRSSWRERTPESYGKGKARPPPGPPPGEPPSTRARCSGYYDPGSWGYPLGPDEIIKQTEIYWERHGSKLRHHHAEGIAKTFKYYDREMQFMLHDFVEGLTFVPTEYSPLLSVRANGQLNYDTVA